MSLKLKTASALSAVGLDRALGFLGKHSRSNLTIFAYHRVFDVTNYEEYRSDLELVSCSSESFASQMKFIGENFTPITFAQLLDCQDRGSGAPKGSAIVTFDDGFSDNYTHAFPILKRLGIPATIFLSTGYVDRHEPFWFEYVSSILLSSSVDLRLEPGVNLNADSTMVQRREALYRFLRYLKRIPDTERIATISRIAAESGLRQIENYPRDRLPLTWEQIGEMSRAGIEFGSHTVNHPVLSKVEDGEMRVELFESKSRIEEMIGKPVQVLSYPVGGKEAFDTRVRMLAKEAGYRIGVAYEPGGNRLASCDWFALRRVRVERYVSFDMFRAMSVLPSVFAT